MLVRHLLLWQFQRQTAIAIFRQFGDGCSSKQKSGTQCQQAGSEAPAPVGHGIFQSNQVICTFLFRVCGRVHLFSFGVQVVGHEGEDGCGREVALHPLGTGSPP